MSIFTREKISLFSFCFRVSSIVAWLPALSKPANPEQKAEAA
jgi:hypothetical protein